MPLPVITDIHKLEWMPPTINSHAKTNSQKKYLWCLIEEIQNTVCKPCILQSGQSYISPQDEQQVSNCQNEGEASECIRGTNGGLSLLDSSFRVLVRERHIIEPLSLSLSYLSLLPPLVCLLLPPLQLQLQRLISSLRRMLLLKLKCLLLL